VSRRTPFGNVIIGSTPEDRGFDKGVDLNLSREFAHSVLRLFPGVRGLQVIRAWAGLRPGTADALPFMEWAPGVEGLFLACGHFRNGVCYAPASGRIVAEGNVHEIRELIEDHPHRIFIQCDDPRRLAGHLVGWDVVAGMRLDEMGVEIQTSRPDAFFTRLPINEYFRSSYLIPAWKGQRGHCACFI